MYKIRRIAAVFALAAVALIGACSEGMMPEDPPAAPGTPSGPSFEKNSSNPPIPFDGTLTTQEDTTGRCTGQAGATGGRC